MKKLYIIQKYVIASSVVEAVKLEKNNPPDDVYLDNDWKKSHIPIIEEKKKPGFK